MDGQPSAPPRPRAGRHLLLQVTINLLVAGVVLFLMPCSPFSLWGSAYCPATPSAAAPTAPTAPAAPATGDFAREVVAASATGPVLVDFHAGWCPPCRKLGPEIDALAAERGDRLRVVKIDVDAQPQVAQAQGVSGIPDVRLWRDGREIARFAGYRSQAEIAAWLDQALAGGPVRVD